ncbi:molecular chaperone GroEL [Rhodoblastus sp.]|uniref:molecular chaperone GroEL n=1 Tax=Rhodoblastus sp. TaxID=1962975 RepID=UPI0035AFD41A
MPKIMLHNSEARQALARGVARLAAAVVPTLGPKGMNAMIDRPVGTPIITRDGVSIAASIELEDRFENMGAQVVREVSMQTNEVAGDGTTTAIVLANALVQSGNAAAGRGAKTVDLCRGIELGVAAVVAALKASARPANNPETLRAVATIAATDPKLGALVAEAHERVGLSGIISADFSVTTETTLDVLEGMSFDRGYLSHHMVTDQEKMEAVLERPFILLTDLKIKDPASLDKARAIADAAGRPLLIVAEEVSPEVIVNLVSKSGVGKYLVVHPPEYGHWRKALLEDMAIMTGGQVVARDLGGRIEDVTEETLGSAASVRTSATHTLIVRGGGDAAAVVARRAQVQRQLDVSAPNIDQDKLRERVAKLSGGAAVLYAGGRTPVEQKRTVQLLEDSLNAVRAAAEEGVVAGGGTALAQVGHVLDPVLAGAAGDVAEGVRLVKSILTCPLKQIALNAGADCEKVVAEATGQNAGYGYNAARGVFQDMFEAGVIDPVRVTTTALGNAASVAVLILTTETLVADLPMEVDPTAGPSRGGGAEKLGRA